MKLCVLYENFTDKELFDLYALDYHDKENPYYIYLLDKIHSDYIEQLGRLAFRVKQSPHGFPDTYFWNHGLFNLLDSVRGIDKMMAIDRINAHMHDNGPFIDYLDESEWLEDALDSIFAADSPADFWGRLSSVAQRALWSHAHKQEKGGEIPLVKRFYARLARTSNATGVENLSMRGNILTGTYPKYRYEVAQNKIVGVSGPEPILFSVDFSTRQSSVLPKIANKQFRDNPDLTDTQFISLVLRYLGSRYDMMIQNIGKAY